MRHGVGGFLVGAIEAVYALFLDGDAPLAMGGAAPNVSISLEAVPWQGGYEDFGWIPLEDTEHDWQRRVLVRCASELAGLCPRVAWRRAGPDAALVVAFSGAIGGSEFLEDEIEFLAALEPHVKRACALQQRQLIRDAMLDELAEAIILVDREGRILRLNESACSVLSDPTSGLLMSGGVLQAQDSQCQRELEALIANTIDSSCDGASRCDVAIRCGTGQHPHRVRVTSVGRESWLPEIGASGGAAIFISDPNRSIRDVERWLLSAYGLTPREVRVASAVADGHTLDAAGTLLDILPSTVKSHLKSVFCKMQISRQSELVRAIAMGCGGVRGDASALKPV